MQKVERVKDRKYLKETPLTNYYFWERTKNKRLKEEKQQINTQRKQNTQKTDRVTTEKKNENKREKKMKKKKKITTE